MDWYETTDSSFIDVIGYDGENQILVVFMHGAHVCYEYRGVPADVLEEFVGADSIGKYFNENIARKYEYRRTDDYDDEVEKGEDTRGRTLGDGTDPHQDEPDEDYGPEGYIPWGHDSYTWREAKQRELQARRSSSVPVSEKYNQQSGCTAVILLAATLMIGALSVIRMEISVL